MSVPRVPTSLRSWMSAVSEIARAVNAAEPLEEVLNRVAVQACELIGFEFCAVTSSADSRSWPMLSPHAAVGRECDCVSQRPRQR